MHKIRVGVLRGGPSSEYDVSLKTGANVLKSLPEKYEGVDIFIDKKGVWHIHGVPHEPHKALKKVDVIFNALHGEYGEDGKVQSFLDHFHIPYTGSRTFASAVAMNKAMAKNIAKREGIKTPHFKVLRKEEVNSETAHEIYRSMFFPAIVKPVSLGSSVGIALARTFADFAGALQKAFSVSDVVLVEEFIQGKEATCGVIDHFRGEHSYALLPIEIRPPATSPFFDYDAKYSGATEEICPGNFSPSEKSHIQEMAKKIHHALGLRHYSRSDFIVHPKRGVYFLEVNTLPGLTNESLLPKALHAIGGTVSNFLDHVITLALEKK
jgi:D-alanine-D-alanine ligase